jgi:hypothetical protein
MDDLFLDHIVEYSENYMRSGKQLMWMFHGRSNVTNKDYVFVAPWGDDESKRKVFNAIRLFTVIHEIDEYAVVSEAWMRTAPPSELDKKDFGKVSEHPDRQECLILVHVRRKNEKRMGRMRMYKMLRTNGGEFAGLGARQPELDPKDLGGDLFDFITPRTPPAELREKTVEIWELGKKIGYVPDMKVVEKTRGERGSSQTH